MYVLKIYTRFFVYKRTKDFDGLKFKKVLSQSMLKKGLFLRIPHVDVLFFAVKKILRTF